MVFHDFISNKFPLTYSDAHLDTVAEWGLLSLYTHIASISWHHLPFILQLYYSTISWNLLLVILQVYYLSVPYSQHPHFQSSWPYPIPSERDTPPSSILRKLQMHAAIRNDYIQITLTYFLSHSSWGSTRRAWSINSFARSRFPKPGSRVSVGLKASW